MSVDKRKDFFDSSAGSWDDKQAKVDWARKAAQVAKWFALAEGQAVLDVGCGTGVLLPHLRRKVKTEGQVVGIDFSFQMLEKAKKCIEDRLSLANAGVGAIPFRQGSFDRVTCFSSFPHFPDKPRALAEMTRVLKVAGRLFVAHLHSSEEIADLHGSVGGAVRMDHLPDPDEMAALMRAVGLVEVSVSNEPGKYLAQGRKA
jgi:ubiquinone/menaquinone biosynthesis C-methylase UbiE